MLGQVQFLKKNLTNQVTFIYYILNYLIMIECFLEFANLLPKFFPNEEEIEKIVTGEEDDGKKQLTNRQPKKIKRKSK